MYHSPNVEDASLFIGLAAIIKKALKNIYDGFVGVEPHIYEATEKILNDALDKGLKLKYNKTNKAFIDELRYNVKVFSAFKAHSQCNDMVALLYDKDGKIRPYNEWLKDAMKISDHQNKTWLKTERNTALRRGRVAAQFKEFEAKKHLYPNLRWLESTSVTVRPEHRMFWNMVRPVEDAFWLSHYPGDEWNCHCGIEQTKDDVSEVPEGDLPEPPPGLDKNPFYSKEIITDTHPLIAQYSSDEQKAIKKELDDLIKKEAE